MGPDSHVRIPTNFTINNSWVSATLLSPCSHAVNRLALKADNEGGAGGVQLLQYFAKPVDSIVQAVAMIAFTFYDHFRDISYDIQSRNIGTVILKSLLTPINLPLKLFCASIGSVGFLLGGASQLVVPYQTIYSVVKGKRAAHFYFYENEIWRSQFNPDSFRMKPITILKPFDISDENPFWNERKKLLEEIDEPLRERIEYGKLSINKAYPEYEDLLKNKANNEKFILDNALSQDKNTKEKLKKSKESLEQLDEIERKIGEARRKWRQIDFISLGYEAVINDGIPFLFKVDW